MKTQIRLISLSIVIVIAVSAWAERVSQEDAAVVANNFMNVTGSTSGAHKVAAKRMVLKKAPAAQEENQFYVYENADGEGWVMVAANDIARPILAYSDEGHFRFDNQPSNVKGWLGKYNRQILQAEENGVQATEEVTQEWKKLRKGAGIRKGTPVVAALIQTKWDQDAPYYNQCPQKNSEHCLTGCVATAMAQVMNYWQWPEQGTGSYSYTTQTLGLSASANFGTTTYDWDNMLLKYTGYYPEGSSSWTTVPSATNAQKNAVATLMYHCGVAVEMDYNISSAGGSGAQTIRSTASSTTAKCAQNALYQNFGYKSTTVKGYYRPGEYGYSAVNDNDWHALLKTELDAARPIMYAGGGYEDPLDEDTYYGHSFICDGYDNTTPTRKYHFNWGWSGYCDGYYDIDNLVPGTGGSGAGQGEYLYDHDIIIGIIPDKPDVTITWSVQGITSTTTQPTGTLVLPASTPSDCSGSGGKKFVGWTASSTVTGSAPADLFTSGSGITVTENKTYYAVYATASTGGGSATPTKASSIAAGDRVVFVCETASKEMTSIGTYGVGTEYSTTPAGTYVFDVVAGSSEGTFSFKNGTDYISWSSGNSLAKSDTKNANSSWNVSFSSGNAIITNASTASRQLQWNAGSPRFACYTSSQTAIQLYKMSGGTTYSDYSLTCSAPEPCTHQISVSKGTPSNGDFSIDKTGSQDNCSVGGLVVTVSGITPAEGYEFGAITQTGIASGVTIDQEAKTVTYAKDVVGSSTINVTFTEKPTYKIRFYDGATKLKEEDLVSGATATPPSNPAGCTEYTFYGWWTETLASSNTTAHKVTDFTVSGAQDYYAVYSHTVTSGGGAASLTKQGSTSSFAAGDNIVIVAKGTTYALYQETVSTSYVKNWSFENSAAIVGTDAKNYVILATAATSGKWYLGDATNGYLYNTSGGNELYVKTDGSKAEWTISWNAGQSAFTIVGGRNLSCRTDLTGGNANKYRSSNGTGTGTCYFDIYKYSSGGSSTTYYTTTAKCVECTNKVTLTKGTPSNGTFALDKADGEYNNCAAGGLVVTVSGITPADGYRFKEITQTGIASGVTIDQEGKTVTYAKDVKGASTINVVFELIPTYTVTWSSNGDESNTAEYHEGDAIVFPSSADGCDDKTFMGWVSATIPTPQDEEPTFVTSATMPAHAVTYYAVFADEDGSGASSLTKMVKDDTFANGDKIVIVAHGTTVALYQETANSSYVQKWTFDNKVTTVAADDKKWITVTSTTGGWYLGDATNGYLNNSNNSLYCDGDQSVWTLYDNEDGTFNLVSTVYLSYRSDLTGSNQLWRGGGATGSSGVSTLDIYKYTSGSTSYSGYSTSCILPTEVTVTFDANGGEGTMAAQVMDYNTATALNTNTFTREGYTFQGWATSTSGAKVYNDEALVTLKKNTTLYAVWQKNSYTITLVDPAHGSIETSPATTAEYGATVTVTVTPSGGYTFGSMTVTNNTTSGTVATSGSGATQTFTMPASDVTITATVTEIPTYTVTWSSNGDESNQVNYYEGDAIVFPGTATGCEGKTFMGWSAVTVAEQDVAPAYTTSATMPAHDVTYYAVFAEASSGSGVPTTETYGFEDSDDDTNWTIDANITKSTSAKATGTYGGIINTAETYITFNNKVKVTNFSFKLARTSNNANYTVYIETSTDGSVWTEAESYAMSSFSNGSFTSKSKDFDGSTDLYVRLYCYNTTAIRYIDDISITYGGGTTYSGYSTTCGASISAQNIGWMTTAAGQKVKRVINVSAKNFDNSTTLSATCANSNFSVTLGASAVPAGTTGLTTTLTVEYTPTASDTRDENVEIVLTAGDKSRTITVSGRSVPDEFLLITKKSSTWYALPANMNSGADQYDGVEVSPNDPTTPTSVAVSPSTLIYNLASVASSRYVDNGHLVRLVGNGNKCLWSNKSFFYLKKLYFNFFSCV